MKQKQELKEVQKLELEQAAYFALRWSCPYLECSCPTLKERWSKQNLV